MFKVRFKKNPHYPTKSVKKFGDGKVTVVTLIGTMDYDHNLPIPNKTWEWMMSHKNIHIHHSEFGLVISTEGKAKRADSDADDPILAERIAESRAKMRLYKFMSTLCEKIGDYYMDKIYGCDPDSYFGPSSDAVIGMMYTYHKFYLREKEHLHKLLVP